MAKNLPWIIGGTAIGLVLLLASAPPKKETTVIEAWREGNMQFRLVETPAATGWEYRYERSFDDGQTWDLITIFPTLTAALYEIGGFGV